MTSEKFCLKWNDFQNNLSGSLRDLRNDNDFCDVTLVSENNQQIQAHRVILASSSLIFMEILKSNKHNHPLIYMRGIKFNDLAAIVDFMYHGEANIYQENLDDFMVLAEELKLKGLSGNKTLNTKQGNDVEEGKSAKHKKETFEEEFEDDNTITESNDTDRPGKTKVEVPNTVVSTQSQGTQIVTHATDMADLNDKLDSMVDKLNGIWTCTVCGKSSKSNSRNDMRRHAETHVEGMSHPCNYCDKTFRCSNALRMHIRKYHY